MIEIIESNKVVLGFDCFFINMVIMERVFLSVMKNLDMEEDMFVEKRKWW